MKSNNIVKKLQEIEALTQKNDNLTHDLIRDIPEESKVSSSQAVNDALKEMSKDNRLLRIGIVGRVKAGKSSLLNALLFDGQSVLPKAATPMTAALTQISYGESLAAEVEFFTQNDIQTIQKNHSQYKVALEEKSSMIFEDMKQRKSRRKQKSTGEQKRNGLRERIKEKAKEKLSSLFELTEAELQEIQIKANKRAERELSNDATLSSAFDQYERMKKSGIDISTIGERHLLAASSMKDLAEKLKEHVGSSGQYMPFTKSVHVRLPQDNLEGLEIVDTPGVNDPVQSREERTRELLKHCDVIFIVSPAGQFLSREDTDLMDRITAREGISELYVVASQIDTQLMGSEKNNFQGDLHQIVDGITSNLGTHMSSTVSQMKQGNPSIGNIFDSLIEQGKTRVIHSAGICQTIKQSFDQPETWDDGTKKVWENLSREYPDYFSQIDRQTTLDSLAKLGNIPKIQNIVAHVREKKTTILEQRKVEFIQATEISLETYLKNLLAKVASQVSEIENGDVNELLEEKKKLDNWIGRSCSEVNETYYDLVDDFILETKMQLKSNIKELFKETKSAVDGVRKTKTKSYKVEEESSWSNLGGLFAGTETRYREVTSVRTGAIVNTIKEFSSELEDEISMAYDGRILSFRRDILRRILPVLRETDQNDDLDANRIKSAVRKTANEIGTLDIDLDNKLPACLSAKGVIKNSEAEEFIDCAKTFASDLKRKTSKDIKEQLEVLASTLKSIDIADQVFSSYREQIEQLVNQIENKQITLDRYQRLEQAIKSLQETSHQAIYEEIV